MQYICEKGSVRKITAEEYEQIQASNKTYSQKRRESYPPIGDQLDAILKYLDTKEDLTEDLEACIVHWKSVKAKYPKTTE